MGMFEHRDWHCICSCRSYEHQIHFDYWQDEDGEKNVYLTIHLPEYPFWKRLWCGLTYIFGHKSNYGNFDEFILTREHARTFREIADKLDELPEEQEENMTTDTPQKTSENMEEKLNNLARRLDNIEQNITRLKTKVPSVEGAMSRETITKLCLESFDFDKVALIMQFLDWKWVDSLTEGGIPTTHEIKRVADGMMAGAWNDLDAEPYDAEGWHEWNVRTGGLEVWVCEGDGRNGHRRLASLKFIAEEFEIE